MGCDFGALSDPPGFKYDCAQCGRFGFSDFIDAHMKLFLRDRKDARIALQAYVRDHQIEGKYLILRLFRITNILRQAGVNVEDLFPSE